MSLTADDIVNGVRKNGRKDRARAVKQYATWADVAEGYPPAFLKWLKKHGGDIDEEKQEFVNVGYVDESFPEFMHKAFENAQS